MCTDVVSWVARCASSLSYILAYRLPVAVAMLPKVGGQQMFIAGQSTQGSRLGHIALLLSTRMHYSSLDLGASGRKVPTEKHLDYEYSIISE